MQVINYVTSSKFKMDENVVFRSECVLKSGQKIDEVFEFVFRSEQIKEILEVDLHVMVQAEVVNAYSKIKVPCIVEHAGLIFEDYKDRLYPGGLTKPMWDTLKERFIAETGSKGRRAIARAVVAYCDGKSIRTFTGETPGTIADAPRGSREFYWDTIFIPDGTSGAAVGKTYAEIVDDASLGLVYKMKHLSQSGKAMKEFLEFISSQPRDDFWGG